MSLSPTSANKAPEKPFAQANKIAKENESGLNRFVNKIKRKIKEKFKSFQNLFKSTHGKQAAKMQNSPDNSNASASPNEDHKNLKF